MFRAELVVMDIGDPRVPVDMEIDKVLDRFSTFEEYSSTSLDNLEEKLQELQDELDESKSFVTY